MDTASYRDYILTKVDERERQQIEYRCFKDTFRAVIEQILDKWGLVDRLQKALATGEKVHILDIGCGTGLLLQEVAATVEERGLIKAAQFFGLDMDRIVIWEAQRLSKEAKTPRPYLHFYAFDVTKPLAACKDFLLDLEGPFEFDLIILSFSLEFLPQAQVQLKKFYDALRPGGLIFSRSVVSLLGDYGWKSPHPACDNGIKNLVKVISSNNKEVLVAKETQAWLREFGAERIDVLEVETPMGGNTPVGLDMLRNLVMAKHNMLPLFLKLGLTTQAEHDAEMKQLFQELSPAYIGHLNSVDTIAKKPE